MTVIPYTPRLQRSTLGQVSRVVRGVRQLHVGAALVAMVRTAALQHLVVSLFSVLCYVVQLVTRKSI